MYLTMNRFKVHKEATAEFEALWMNRDSHLDRVPGYKAFELMRGPEASDHVVYASHTTWESKQAFEDWTRSEAFRAAHKGAGGSKHLYLEPPVLEIFETVASDAT